jgi:hypothetical protein
MMRGPSSEAIRTGIGGFYLVMAGINIGIAVAESETYRHFADGGLFAFVREGWLTIVMSNPGLWIGLLAAGELLIGVALLIGDRWTLPAYGAIIAFHLALVLFGWGFLTWAAPVVLLLAIATRRELTPRQRTKDPSNA